MKWLVALGLTLSLGASSGTTPDEDPVSQEMAVGARQLLQSLDPGERDAATYTFSDEERQNWHFVPKDRAGLSLKTATPTQRLLAQRLLATGLSTHGMQRALDIMSLELVLFEKEGRAIRDPELYFVTIFGEPTSSSDWGFRVEGHHLSANFSLRDGKLQSTSPLFMGANPANVLDGRLSGMRALAAEEELGRALFESFDAKDQARILIDAKAPDDIVTGASRVVDLGSRQGLAGSAMSPTQRARMLELVELYARRLRPEIAGAELARIASAGHDAVHFAWAGDARPGEAHYYRIHGPSFLIEYDNTQNDANHIHTVWRDLTGDFGLSDADPLSEHYARSPHHSPEPARRSLRSSP